MWHMPCTEGQSREQENYTVVGKTSAEMWKGRSSTWRNWILLLSTVVTNLKMAQIIPVLSICISAEFVPVLYWVWSPWLKPCNLDWDSNPRSFHGDHTWSQDLMELRFLMSHHRKNSVRDKVTGKKWIYSDSERLTLHRQNVDHCRGWIQLRNAG